MSTLDKVKQHTGLIVLHEFFYGSPPYFWLLDMTADQFEQWWTSQETFGRGNPPELQAAFPDEPAEDYIPQPPLPGSLLRTESQAEVDAWSEMAEAKPHYYSNICCDDDSFLKTPDGRTLYHKGDRSRQNGN